MREAVLGWLVTIVATLVMAGAASANDAPADKGGDKHKEAAKEAGKEAGKGVVKGTVKEAEKSAAKEPEKESSKETSKESPKAAAKEGAREAAAEPAKAAKEAAREPAKESAKESKEAAREPVKGNAASLDEVRAKIEAAIERRRLSSVAHSRALHSRDLSLQVRAAPSSEAARASAHGAPPRQGAWGGHGGHGGHGAPRVATLTDAHGAGVAGGAGGGHGGDLFTPHWSYQGEAGPAEWGRLKPEFNKCSTGTRQSPIDIRDGVKVDLEPIRIAYQPSGFSVIDNGHTVQVNVAPGNTITVSGRRYDLLQFHFHRPSEERVNGRRYDMVAHLVHKDGDGRLAVVAVLLERGAAQGVIQTVWNNLPLEQNEEVSATAAIDMNLLLPADKSYFTYMGSLTTPPCTEGVLWLVMRQPVQVSVEQINIFTRLYPMNARPIQSASGRLIKESN